MICQRCTKNVAPEGIHTCTPTDGWRKLEAMIMELEAALNRIDTWAFDAPELRSIARAAMGEKP